MLSAVCRPVLTTSSSGALALHDKSICLAAADVEVCVDECALPCCVSGWVSLSPSARVAVEQLLLQNVFAFVYVLHSSAGYRPTSVHSMQLLHSFHLLPSVLRINLTALCPYALVDAVRMRNVRLRMLATCTVCELLVVPACAAECPSFGCYPEVQATAGGLGMSLVACGKPCA